MKWYLSFNKSKCFLHDNSYEKAKELFNLNTALIQTARDKAVEVIKSFEESKNKKEGGLLRLKSISIRFDKRLYSFSKTTNVLTPYWLTLSLNRRERMSLPIVFGERQREKIEEAFRGEWKLRTVEAVKRYGEWHARFVLKKRVELADGPETVIAIDRGEVNLAAAVSKKDPNKPIKRQFWRGEGIKRIRGLYSHIRRELQKKHRIGKIKELKGKERRKIDRQLHIIANQVVAYAKLPQTGNSYGGFEWDPTELKSKRLNRRFHSLPFRGLQTIVEYKANLEGVEVRYLSKEEAKNTSKECHRCWHIVQVKGRI
ncbi:MAG: RNA-guided endonuclease InsQ/TnpB family protein [Candidatus Methanomethylicaceae archaeon]